MLTTTERFIERPGYKDETLGAPWIRSALKKMRGKAPAMSVDGPGVGPEQRPVRE